MKLKSATKLVMTCLIVWLVIGLMKWCLLAFGIMGTYSIRILFRGIELIQLFLLSIPLITFFAVLNSKQKGE